MSKSEVLSGTFKVDSLTGSYVEFSNEERHVGCIYNTPSGRAELKEIFSEDSDAYRNILDVWEDALKKKINLFVRTDNDGIPVEWYEVPNEGDGFTITYGEYTSRFGREFYKYRIENGGLVYREELQPPEIVPIKTDQDIIWESLLDVDYRLTLMEMGV